MLTRNQPEPFEITPVDDGPSEADTTVERSSVAEAAPWSYARLMDMLRAAQYERSLDQRPVEPIVLHPKQYARWKANGWIR